MVFQGLKCSALIGLWTKSAFTLILQDKFIVVEQNKHFIIKKIINKKKKKKTRKTFN